MSLQGTLGPYVRGSSTPAGLRIRVATIFSAMFLVGAIVTFGTAALAGSTMRALPFGWRVGAAAATLLILACVDIFAMRTGVNCPLGWRRQTPKGMMRRLRPPVLAAAWGFDTGLAFTTFRVAAATWGALALTLLGLTPWWTGISYGLAFVIPMLWLLFTQFASPQLQLLFRRRPLVQALSAVVMTAGAIVLLV